MRSRRGQIFDQHASHVRLPVDSKSLVSTGSSTETARRWRRITNNMSPLVSFSPLRFDIWFWTLTETNRFGGAEKLKKKQQQHTRNRETKKTRFESARQTFTVPNERRAYTYETMSPLGVVRKRPQFVCMTYDGRFARFDYGRSGFNPLYVPGADRRNRLPYSSAKEKPPWTSRDSRFFILYAFSLWHRCQRG